MADMVKVLSIDLASRPAEACVASVDGRRVEVLEVHRASLGELFTEAHLRAHTNGAAADSAGEGAHEPIEADPAPLGELVKRIQQDWSNAIVIIPPHECISLNLTLPFGDAKNVEKIIDMEVQDVVPFDTSEFLLQYRVVDALPNGTFDVHVTLIPKRVVEEVLRLCKAAGVEPLVVSTPSGVLNGVYDLAPEYVAENSAVVLATPEAYHFAIAQGGQVKIDRVVRRQISVTSGNGNGATGTENFFDVKLTIAAVERKYDVRIERIYFIGSNSELQAFAQAAARQVEQLAISELVQANRHEAGIAGLSAIFVRDLDPPPPLVNFRIREFSYSPELRGLFMALRQLTPYLAGLLAAVILCFGSIYLIRDLREARLRKAMRESIHRVAPDLALPEGNELAALRGQIRSLQTQLENIGAAAVYPALDALLEVTRTLSRVSDENITKVEIRGDRVVIEGTANDYSHFARVKAVFQRRKPVRCRLKKERSNQMSRGQVSFTIELQCGEK